MDGAMYLLVRGENVCVAVATVLVFPFRRVLCVRPNCFFELYFVKLFWIFVCLFYSSCALHLQQLCREWGKIIGTFQRFQFFFLLHNLKLIWFDFYGFFITAYNKPRHRLASMQHIPQYCRRHTDKSIDSCCQFEISHTTIEKRERNCASMYLCSHSWIVLFTVIY